MAEVSTLTCLSNNECDASLCKHLHEDVIYVIIGYLKCSNLVSKRSRSMYSYLRFNYDVYPCRGIIYNNMPADMRYLGDLHVLIKRRSREIDREERIAEGDYKCFTYLYSLHPTQGYKTLKELKLEHNNIVEILRDKNVFIITTRDRTILRCSNTEIILYKTLIYAEGTKDGMEMTIRKYTKISPSELSHIKNEMRRNSKTNPSKLLYATYY